MLDESDAWFNQNPVRGLGAVHRDNDISFLVDAEEYFADLRHEVEATVADDWIFWIGFDVGRMAQPGVSPPDYIGHTPMPSAPSVPTRRPFDARPKDTGDKDWMDLLTAADSRGVNVRALHNLHPKPTPSNVYKALNFDVVAKINSLTHGSAINDFRYLWLNGTHHQKLVMVKRRDQLVVYIGTADVQEDRIVNRWCELQCKVTGGAEALQLYNVFYGRWTEHSAALKRLGTAKAYIPDFSAIAPGTGRGHFVTQIATTYGNPQRTNPLHVIGPPQQNLNRPHCIDLSGLLASASFPLSVLPALPRVPLQIGNDFFLQKDSAAVPLVADAQAQSPAYGGDRSRGTTAIYEMIIHAIERANEFIYLEDQYLVCDQPMTSGSVTLRAMADVLADKLQSAAFKKLVVFCPRLASINTDMLGVAGPHRRNFIQKLVAAGGNKVVVCQYKSNRALGRSGGGIFPDGSPFYIHSKTWVFDDLLLITGSANCNRRGYSHDSELDIAVYDPNKTAIRDLRVKLWMRRLNTEAVTTPLVASDLQDPMKAMTYWEDPATHGLTIENHRIGLDVFLGNWAPLGLQTSVRLAGGLPAPAQMIPNLVGMTADALMWDVIVDPSGT
jgi:phosphatidylserine/phosphatidylglycerophosphate/cardiolipin synthase-like enzyme